MLGIFRLKRRLKKFKICFLTLIGKSCLLFSSYSIFLYSTSVNLMSKKGYKGKKAKSAGYAFVSFASEVDARRAIQEATELQGRQLVVDFAKPQVEKIPKEKTPKVQEKAEKIPKTQPKVEKESKEKVNSTLCFITFPIYIFLFIINPYLN